MNQPSFASHTRARARTAAMPPTTTTTVSSSSLRALLDAESADVVRELLDDGCKSWCDDLRAGPSARRARLAKNAAKSAEALRLETHGEAEACAEACEAFVRRAVWTMGEDARPGTTTTTTTTSALGFEPGSGHARLDALLVERALERRHKWREKSAAAAAMPGRFLADFDWAVRASTTTSTRTTTTRNDDDDDDEDDEDDHPDAVCRAAARLVVRDAGAESSSVVDVRFDIHPRALRRVAASCAAARRAAETRAPDAAAEESDAPSTTATA